MFSTGISNGAAMTMALAELWPGYFAAVAPVAGINAIPARAGASLPVCAFHGTDDRIVPVRGQHLVRRAAAGRRLRRVGADRVRRFELPRSRTS